MSGKLPVTLLSRTIFAVGFFACALPFSAADELKKPLDFPFVDVEANCGRYKSNSIVAECIRKEQYYYSLSKEFWPQLDTADKSRLKFWGHSQSTVDIDSPIFYQALWTLIGRGQLLKEQKARETAAPPKFRY